MRTWATPWGVLRWVGTFNPLYSSNCQGEGSHHSIFNDLIHKLRTGYSVIWNLNGSKQCISEPMFEEIATWKYLQIHYVDFKATKNICSMKLRKYLQSVGWFSTCFFHRTLTLLLTQYPCNNINGTSYTILVFNWFSERALHLPT